MMTGTSLRGPLRVSIGVLWLVGAALAVPTVGLLLLAVQTFRGCNAGHSSSTWFCSLGFVIVVGGSLWELGHVDPSKAAQLRAMGFDPSFAVGRRGPLD